MQNQEWFAETKVNDERVRNRWMIDTSTDGNNLIRLILLLLLVVFRTRNYFWNCKEFPVNIDHDVKLKMSAFITS